ncbi:MAG: TrmB family transcriptional regulator [Candidatus Woesearchaeota archaeon]|nr:MAG: TrmB family transcriptional regulator [Candidatus Woesearchaeota archaeon]
MIVDEEFLSKLRRSFNLNLYEVKLWTALLSRGISTAGELSDMAAVPRSRTYDVLESLERRGFVVVKPEKPIKYMAISPHEVVDRVRKRVEEKAERSRKKLDDLHNSDILEELSILYKQSIEPMDPTEFSGALKGRHNIYDHLGLLVKEAKDNISILTTEEGLIRKVRSLKPLLEKAKGRGVKIKIGAPLTEKTKDIVSRIEGIAEIKNVKDVEARFCIADGKQTVFMLTHDKEVHPSYDTAMWVNSPFFAGALQQMFEATWAAS